MRAETLAVIEITWLDAVLDNRHSAELDDDVADFGGAVECQDVGYLVRWSPHEIVLAVSRCIKDNDVRHSNTIPKLLITDVKLLSGELPCPLTSLVPTKRRKKQVTSHPGSSNTPGST